MDAWWDRNSPIPFQQDSFRRIAYEFVINCPASVRRSTTVRKNGTGKAVRKTEYRPVSTRASTFRDRGISNSLLNTVAASIRRPLKKYGTYRHLESSASVEAVAEEIERTVPYKDQTFEIIVICKRNEMSEAESVYYGIRNAFAHGSFDVITVKGKNVYRFECKRDGKTKALMRLKESTLLSLIDLMNKTAKEIQAMQKHRLRKM